MEHYPRVSLDVELLDGSPIASGLVAYGVNESRAEGAAVGSSNSLLQRRQGLLIHGADFEVLALLQVLPSQRATNDVNVVFELGNAKVDPIVHHLS